MGKRKKAHVGPHKYQRILWKSRKVEGEPYYIFKCMLPGCTHFVPRELVIGNECECWRCGKTFIMTLPATYLKKPHCMSCTKGRPEDVSVDDVTANLDKILGGF